METRTFTVSFDTLQEKYLHHSHPMIHGNGEYDLALAEYLSDYGFMIARINPDDYQVKITFDYHYKVTCTPKNLILANLRPRSDMIAPLTCDAAYAERATEELKLLQEEESRGNIIREPYYGFITPYNRYYRFSDALVAAPAKSTASHFGRMENPEVFKFLDFY
jgi:hypothetical protein